MHDRKIDNKWLPEVTIAKGIGIILVVIGHCVPDVFRIKQFIYLFHMPLFFFLSGYCFRVNTEEKMTSYVLRKVKSLYFPFVACNCFALLFHQIFCKIGVYPDEQIFQSAGQFTRYFVKILLCIKMEDVVAPLWFLPILFVVNIGYTSIRKIVSRVNLRHEIVHVFVLAIYLIGFLVPRSGFFRAYVLSSLGLFSYDIGFLFKKYRIIDKMSNWMVMIFTIALLISAQFIDINMIQMRIGNPVQYSMLSMMGICVVLIISKMLAKFNTILYYVGENSIVILEWHYYVFLFITIIQKYMISGTIHDGISSFVQYYLSSDFYKFCWFIIYVVFGCCIPLVINRLMQALSEKRKKEENYNHE